MDRWNEHTMEMELESMDRQGEAVEIRLSSLGLAGAVLGEREIERLQAENARLREALDKVRAERENAQSQLIAARERLIDINNQAVMELPATEDTTREALEWIIRRAKVDFDLLKEDESWLVRHDAEVRAQAIQDLADRYGATCRSLYIRAKREGTREERERCLTRRYPIPFRAIEAVLTYYPPKEDKIVREWLEDISAAIRNQEENDE